MENYCFTHIKWNRCPLLSIAVRLLQAKEQDGMHGMEAKLMHIDAKWSKCPEQLQTNVAETCTDSICASSAAHFEGDRESAGRTGKEEATGEHSCDMLWYSFAPCTFPPPGKKRHTRNRWSNAKKALLLDLLKSPHWNLSISTFGLPR